MLIASAAVLIASAAVLIASGAVLIASGAVNSSQVLFYHLVSRHALREHQFDSDPGWLGPRYMTRFWAETDWRRRRTLIQRARHRGSVPPDVHRSLQRAFRDGDVQWHQDLVAAAQARETSVLMTLTQERELRVDRVFLATGFSAERPGGAMLDELIRTESLRCAPCGFPVVDHALRWHPRVHVTGPLAELELGPTARNIAGARHAAERILSAPAVVSDASVGTRGSTALGGAGPLHPHQTGRRAGAHRATSAA